VLTIENLSFHYGSTSILSGVSLLLQPGITGIIGAEGAGKTTLLRLVLGLLVPASGSIHLFGGDPSRNSALRRQSGYLPQQFTPGGSMPAADYLEALTLLAGPTPPEARILAHSALEEWGLSEVRLHSLASLTKAEIRRLGVAQALAHRPRLLLLDEPVAGLAAGERQELLDKLREMAEAQPILVTSHAADKVERIADHLWLLEAEQLTAANGQRG
jgi:ABC-2 type transport system ATP-binding protein